MIRGARAWRAFPALSAPLTMMGVERRWFLLSATFALGIWNAMNSIMVGAVHLLRVLCRGLVGLERKIPRCYSSSAKACDPRPGMTPGEVGRAALVHPHH